jgi:hypothetical protein
MNSSELPDRSPEVIALLRAHGVPSAAARLLARLGETLRRQTDQEGTEFAILVDLEDEQQAGHVLQGDEDRVPLTSHLRLLQPGRRYAHLHTHPWSTSFSDFDLAILLQNIPLRTIVVVGADGSWYLLSKLRGKPTAAWQTGLIHGTGR